MTPKAQTPKHFFKIFFAMTGCTYLSMSQMLVHRSEPDEWL